MTGGHEMWRDKSLHKITRSGGIAVLLKKEKCRRFKRREAISNWIGNVMGRGGGGLNHDTGGSRALNGLNPECFVGSCYLSIQKHKSFRPG